MDVADYSQYCGNARQHVLAVYSADYQTQEGVKITMKIIKLSFKRFQFIFTGILAAALLLNIIGIAKRVLFKVQIPLVLGYGKAVVISGSMEPAILPGDFIVIHRQENYDVGDIVTYQTNGRPVTHRIVEKTPGGYITQGDANNTCDREIGKEQIIGRVVKTISGAGNVILFFQNPVWILMLFAVIAAPWLLQKVYGAFADENENL